ncbi:MAG: molybdopterin-guanine dinucleotide biosynthesis protein B [Candidatus Aminicenantia bacterium]
MRKKQIIPIICIVGKSDSGKTTIIEKLIHELKRRGLKVGTVKHDVHEFEIDKEGKDSYRHKRAGAEFVLLSSPNKIALIKDVEREYTLDELREKFIEGVDLVLAEGFKRSSFPKIEVFRKDLHKDLLCSETDNLIAIVSQKKFTLNVPHFNFDEISKLADFLITKFLK